MARANYNAYMRSYAWRKRRDEYFTRHLKRCRACGDKERIQLHHLNYDNFGAETDDDLLPLCKYCHDAVHDLQKRERITISAATHLFIKLKKRKNKKTLQRKGKTLAKSGSRKRSSNRRNTSKKPTRL